MRRISFLHIIFFLSIVAIGTLMPLTGSANAQIIPSLESFKVLANLPGTFLGIMGGAMLTVIALVTWLAGIFLNGIIQVSVLGMKDIIDSMEAINTGWEIFRDVANICFIFILLYISIAVILRLDSFNVKRVLRNVVIIALLINFSLFFTQVIIDLSNVLAIHFYQKAGLSSGAQLFETLFSLSHLGSLYDFNPAGVDPVDFANNLVNPIDIFVTMMGSAVFLLIFAFVMLVAGLFFALRFGVLIFLMVLSPLAYLAMILPQTAGHAKKWWNELFCQAFFAPSFFLLMWVVLELFEGGGFGGLSTTDSFSTLFQGGIKEGTAAFFDGGVILLLNYGMLILFILMALVLSKKIGCYGSSGALKLAGNIRGWAGQKAGWVGQQTIGRAARGLSQSSRVQDALSKVSVSGGARVQQGLKKISSASFGGSKGGFNKRIEENAKARTEFIQGLTGPKYAERDKFVTDSSGVSRRVKAGERESLEVTPQEKAKASLAKTSLPGSLLRPSSWGPSAEVTRKSLEKEDKKKEKIQTYFKQIARANTEIETLESRLAQSGLTVVEEMAVRQSVSRLKDKVDTLEDKIANTKEGDRLASIEGKIEGLNKDKAA